MTTDSLSEYPSHTVVIMRGPPGSGKSKYAQELLQYSGVHPNARAVVSAEQFFLRDGVYVWNPLQLQQAHRQCFAQFVRALEAHATLIVVDNTNIRLAEITPYARLAEAKFYTVQIIRIACPKDIAFPRNSHGVQEETYDRMSATIEPLTYGLTERIVTCDHDGFHPPVAPLHGLRSAKG